MLFSPSGHAGGRRASSAACFVCSASLDSERRTRPRATNLALPRVNLLRLLCCAQLERAVALRGVHQVLHELQARKWTASGRKRVAKALRIPCINTARWAPWGGCRRERAEELPDSAAQVKLTRSIRRRPRLQFDSITARQSISASCLTHKCGAFEATGTLSHHHRHGTGRAVSGQRVYGAYLAAPHYQTAPQASRTAVLGSHSKRRRPKGGRRTRLLSEGGCGRVKVIGVVERLKLALEELQLRWLLEGAGHAGHDARSLNEPQCRTAFRARRAGYPRLRGLWAVLRPPSADFVLSCWVSRANVPGFRGVCARPRRAAQDGAAAGTRPPCGDRGPL